MGWLVPLGVLICITGSLAYAPAGAAGGEGQIALQGWPSLDDATIRPGAQLLVDDNECTANFVFRSPDNATLYIGMAAHCAAVGGTTQTNGCETPTLPLGTPVTIQGAAHPGTVAYSSWVRMQELPELDPITCAYNDFALVRIDAADRVRVHPAMFHYGGPTGLVGVPPEPSTKVLTVGASATRPDEPQFDRREGRVVSNSGGGWSTTILTATPGIPGDSGSGVLLGDGRALGSLSTVSLAPVPGSNGIANLAKALPYAAAAGTSVELVTWDLLDAGLVPV